MTAAMLSPLPCPGPGIARSAANLRLHNMLPFPTAGDASPHQAGPPGFPTSWPSPLGVLPTTVPAGAVEVPSPPPRATAMPAFPGSPQNAPAPQETEDPPDFTDDDLREAFGPIVEQAVRKAVYANENGIDTYLEPMLRATIRRALAEYAPASRPFQPPGVLDRFFWHVRALFSSRTYEDIFFEKTRRFQVEEVFLLDARTLALVSFASCDPARHASVRRVTGTSQQLALQVRDEKGQLRPVFNLSDQRSVIARQGRYVILAALVRGRPGQLVLADLEFALRRIEDHFREQFQQEGSALLYPLQPFLEDCLLIQAPASSAAV